jgi:hypothetical protein
MLKYVRVIYKLLRIFLYLTFESTRQQVNKQTSKFITKSNVTEYISSLFAYFEKVLR